MIGLLIIAIVALGRRAHNNVQGRHQHVTFTPVASLAGFKDSYEVFTEIGRIRRRDPIGPVIDSFTDPLNGCSMPAFLQRLQQQLTISEAEDATLRTFNVNITLDANSTDQTFTVGLRVCRKPTDTNGYVWCVAYELISVCNGTLCPSPRSVAVVGPRESQPSSSSAGSQAANSSALLMLNLLHFIAIFIIINQF